MEAADSSRPSPRRFPLPAVLLVSVLLHAGLLTLVRTPPPRGSARDSARDTALESPALRATLAATAVTPLAPVHAVPARLAHAAAGLVRAPVSFVPPRKVATEDRPVLLPRLPTTVAPLSEAQETVTPTREAQQSAAPAREATVAAAPSRQTAENPASGASVAPATDPDLSGPTPVATAHEARSGWGARRPPAPMPPLQVQDGRAAVARAVLQGVREAVRASLSGVLRELATAGDGSCEVAVTDDIAAFESTCDSGALAQALAGLSEPARISVSSSMRAIGARRLGISTAAGQAYIALR
jgi:hypothetical protein